MHASERHRRFEDRRNRLRQAGEARRKQWEEGKVSLSVGFRTDATESIVPETPPGA